MSPDHEPLLRLTDLGRVFLTEDVETHALADIQLEVRAGEYLSIEGPSGSGKSTLLAILGLLDSASSGCYELAGHDVQALNGTQRAALRNEQIGFVFQSFNLIGDLSVADNVELPLTYRDMPRAERRERVDAALEQVGMSHRARHMPGQLSGGQQQRVAVARAVVGRPALLLADEPTGNLDSSNGQAVMELLDSLHQAGTTILMVTHDPRYGRYADRMVRLFDGRIAEDAVGRREAPPAMRAVGAES